MIGTIRKHQTWLWSIIIALMGVSLIVFFSNDARLSRGERGSEGFGTMNGKPIPAAEYLEARREVMIAHFLRTGNWPGSDEQTSRSLENETVSRVMLISKLKELNIYAGEKAMALMYHEQIRDTPMVELEKKYLAPQGLTGADYERYVRHEVGIRQLVTTASLGARLITPSEAEALYRKEYQEFEVQAVLVWASNYLDKVVITNGAIEAFYTNRQAFYIVPERTILSYVEFPATNFLAEAEKKQAAITNLEARINEIYFARNTNDPFWKDDAGAPLSEADAKKKVREKDRDDTALLEAHRAAADFGNGLIEPKSVPGLDLDANKLSNLEKLASMRSLAVKTTQPFDTVSGLEEFETPTNAPADTGLRAAIRRAAADLKETAPIRFNPIPGPHAVYIVARKGVVARETPPLEKVATKVTNDYKMSLALEMALKAGAAFGTNVTNGIALGKSFADLCKADGMQLIDIPRFSEVTQSLTNFDSRIPVGVLQRKLQEFQLEIGKATPFFRYSQEAGLVMYLKDKPKFDDAKVQAALPDFMGQLRIYRQNETFNQWFRKQAEQARLSLPKRETASK